MIFIILLTAACLSLASCAQKENDEILAVSKQSLEEEALAAQAEFSVSAKSALKYTATKKSTEEVIAPNFVISHGKAGEAPLNLMNYSWYYSDTGVFNDSVSETKSVSGVTFCIEKTYIKNLGDMALQQKVNNWIDSTIIEFTNDKAIEQLLGQLEESGEESTIYIYQNNYCSNGVLSIEVQMDIYPSVIAYSVATFTCDIATGKELSLGDLFYNNFDYLDYVNRQICEQVRSPGFFEVDFSELKRPFSGIQESYSTFTVSGASINIYFPFGNEFFSTGVTVTVPVCYKNYVYSNPERMAGFGTSTIVRQKQLIKGPAPSSASYKTVDNENKYNLASIRFNTGDNAFDDAMNACVVSAEASDFAPTQLRDALSDYISPEEQVKYRIDVTYLQSTLLGGRFLFIEYQISSISKDNTYTSRRIICIDTVSLTRFSFEKFLPGDLPWIKKAVVISENYYNLSTAKISDILNVSVKQNGSMILTFALNKASLISDTKTATVTVDASCFDWSNYISY